MSNNDFLFTNTDILTADGDLATGNSNGSNIVDTLFSYPGEWLLDPLSVSGIDEVINTTRPVDVGRIIAPIVADGFPIEEVDKIVSLIINK